MGPTPTQPHIHQIVDGWMDGFRVDGWMDGCRNHHQPKEYLFLSSQLSKHINIFFPMCVIKEKNCNVVCNVVCNHVGRGPSPRLGLGLGLGQNGQKDGWGMDG